ncbi:eukaryotic translation initiation factor 2-alpha kinase 1 isoform X2 [Anabrus simplex]|uniref:eukaryotic translation initiation factor 2-alpha kinase 1 isoform X2 n=1 Tax=Anabrus simplex TaxID=316456 RepID=UPI0035A38D46
MQQGSSVVQRSKRWSDLSTNTTIDTGSTQPVDGVANVVVHSIQRSSVSSLLVESLIEQLCKLLEPNPVNQRALYEAICSKLYQMKLIDKTYGLEEFGVIRSHYQRELMRFLHTAKSTILNGADPRKSLLQYSSPNAEGSHSLVFQEFSLNSRYSTDYVEVEYLAKGGFGEVYKARNKLDGEEYAIKKIWLCYRNRNYFIQSLREVKLLARLNHPNIVSYKAAWLEPMSPVQETGREKNIFDNFSPPTLQDSREEPISTVESEEDSGGIVFKESSSDIPMVKSDVQCCVESTHLESCGKSIRNEGRQSYSSSSSSKRALCKFQYDEKISSLQQFDLASPSNIFVNKDVSKVQVGDLGLACIFQHAPQDIKFVNQVIWSLDHRGEIGTKLYAAPEQLKGECNPKSDIYSLGIVLFELIQPFSTDMERSKLLSHLRDGNFPSKLNSTSPKLVHFIQMLMATDPADRPTTENVLTELDSITQESSSEAFLSSSPDETIRQLRADLSRKDLEIEELKRKVQALEASR